MPGIREKYCVDVILGLDVLQFGTLTLDYPRMEGTFVINTG